jgi:ubiquitin carboxyl-terminal hydrolase 9/24
VLNNSNKGKWFKFNDTIVEEFEMGDAAVEAECFGGTYKAKVYEQCKYSTSGRHMSAIQL